MHHEKLPKQDDPCDDWSKHIDKLKDLSKK